MWEDPHAKFMDRLMRERLEQLLDNKISLQNLRFDHDKVKWWLRRAGYILDEKGLNLYEEIARACGEIGGDDEKCSF